MLSQTSIAPVFVAQAWPIGYAARQRSATMRGAIHMRALELQMPVPVVSSSIFSNQQHPAPQPPGYQTEFCELIENLQQCKRLYARRRLKGVEDHVLPTLPDADQKIARQMLTAARRYVSTYDDNVRRHTRTPQTYSFAAPKGVLQPPVPAGTSTGAKRRMPDAVPAAVSKRVAQPSC